ERKGKKGEQRGRPGRIGPANPSLFGLAARPLGPAPQVARPAPPRAPSSSPYRWARPPWTHATASPAFAARTTASASPSLLGWPACQLLFLGALGLHAKSDPGPSQTCLRTSATPRHFPSRCATLIAVFEFGRHPQIGHCQASSTQFTLRPPLQDPKEASPPNFGQPKSLLALLHARPPWLSALSRGQAIPSGLRRSRAP
ncbi:hypothetical protein U9M48_035531, partial [Paspalum notatum var. saurae]